MSVSDQTTAFFEQRPSSHPATLPTKRDTETSPKVKSGDGQTNAYLRPAVKRKYSGVEVEELSEDDIGYASDIEVIYPDELEEVEGDTESGDDWPSENNLGDPESLMVRRMSELQCQDGKKKPGRSDRRQKQLGKRPGSGLFKRTHSQSQSSDAQPETPPPMADQDKVRRLRRRVRGPVDAVSSNLKDQFSGQSSESGSPGGDALEARSCTQSPAREDGGRKTTAPVAFWVLEDPMDIDSADG